MDENAVDQMPDLFLSVVWFCGGAALAIFAISKPVEKWIQGAE
jgi:hypothetical protein